MGIELPPELADVAAKAGVRWPAADEEAMVRTAQAWREAATGMSRLSADADSAVRTTLDAVTGQTGDAAAKHWSTFVEPDTGHLSSAVRGCSNAADRLEHAATQVGTAKVEIVRNLVALAQNSDAAHHAAAAGNPNALAGLETMVRGTSANVTHITGSLVDSVQPQSGVDVSTLQAPANANPGVHAPVVDAVVSTVDNVVDGTVNTVADTALPGDARPGQGDLLPGQGDDGAGQPGGPLGPGSGLPDGPRGTIPDLGNAQPSLPVDPGLPGGPGDVGPGLPADPDVTGPVPVDRLPGAVGPGHLDDLPTPPSGLTSQAGFVDAAAAPHYGGNLPHAAPPIPGAAPPAAAGFGPGGPAFGPPGAPTFGPPGAGAIPPPVGGLAPPPPAPGAVPAQPGQPGLARPTSAGPAAAGHLPRPVGGVLDVPVDQPRGKVALGGPPGAPPPWKGDKDGVLAAFWIHMFPIGHLPVASYRPARQLPPPHEELDYAAGVRFAPADHPRHDLVDSADRRAALAEGADPVEPPVGLPADDERVATLADGHDPLGGEHERDWERRYLARFGSVTAAGYSTDGAEFSWPFSEVNPEGGTAPGEPEVLEADTVLDRFGAADGRVFAADGTPFAQRSLPPPHLALGYHRYRVLRSLPVWRAVSAPWFAQPGGGIRYRATHSAAELVALGYLEDVTEGTGA